jgi:hypothetical protein
MRRRRQKLNPDPDSLASAFARKHDPALLLLLRQRIHQHNRFPLVHLIAQHQQTAMCVDHQSLAHLTKFPPVVRAPLRLQPHLVEDALTSACRGKGCFVHVLMMEFTWKPVNCPFGQVSSKRHFTFGMPSDAWLVITSLTLPRPFFAFFRVFP